MANPQFFTLSADTEKVFTLDTNFGQVEVALVANPANTSFNATNTPIASVAGGPVDGHHLLTSTLLAKVVRDETSGATVVRVRSSGTPTVSVLGL